MSNKKTDKRFKRPVPLKAWFLALGLLAAFLCFFVPALIGTTQTGNDSAAIAQSE